MMAAEPDHGDGTGNVCMCCSGMSWLAALSGGRASGLPNATDTVWRQVTAFYRRQGKGQQSGNQRTPGAPAEWSLGSRSWESGSEAAEVALAGWSRAASSRAAHSSEHRSIRRNRCFVCGVPTQSSVCERFRKEAVRLPRRLPRRPKATQASVGGCTCSCSQPVLRQFREFTKGKKRVLII